MEVTRAVVRRYRSEKSDMYAENFNKYVYDEKFTFISLFSSWKEIPQKFDANDYLSEK